MTGYLLAALRDLVLTPQATVVDVERRAFLDPDAIPLNVNAQELDLAPVGTTILAESTGDSLELRHTITAALSVEHGDPAEAMRLRDLVTVDLVLRFLGARSALLALVDPDSGQYGTRANVEVSYAPLAVAEETLVEYATLVFTFDTTLDL